MAGLKKYKLSGADTSLYSIVLSRQAVANIEKVWNLEIIKQMLVVEGRRRSPTEDLQLPDSKRITKHTFDNCGAAVSTSDVLLRDHTQPHPAAGSHNCGRCGAYEWCVAK